MTNEQTQGETTTTAGGRRPRWSPAEDAFLKKMRATGMAKGAVVEAYKREFPSQTRPDAGILARVPSLDAALGRNTNKEALDVAEDRVREEGPLSLGDAVREVYDVIRNGQVDPQKVLNSVAVLFGLTPNVGSSDSAVHVLDSILGKGTAKAANSEMAPNGTARAQ